jgi:hypothetical protein
MRHLDEDALRMLEAGDGETREYFATHLSIPCDECESFLVKVERPGLLGAAADAALTVRAADADAPLDEVGFRRVRQALERSRPSPSSASSRTR